MRRYRAAWCAWLLVISVVLFAISGCAFLNPVTSSDIARLKAQIALDYPGWVVEHVYTQGSQGLLGKAATVSVVLRWPGPQDFRLNIGFFYGGGSGRPNWTHSEPSLLQDHQAAQTFITAFKRRHPEPGLIVLLHGYTGGDTTSSISGAGPDGEIFQAHIWTQSGFAASNGNQRSGGPNGALEDWTAGETSGVIVWSTDGS